MVRPLLLSLLACACTGKPEKETPAPKTYALPNPSAAVAPEDKVAALSLDAISKGISAVAGETSKAVVLVSTAKEIEGTPFELMNPFEFFFGPGFGQPFHGPQRRRQEGLGSGFFIDLDQGYIVTNNHVIEGVDEINLKLANGETYEAKVLGRDKRTDVAVVRIKQKDFRRENLSVLSFADSGKVSAGEFVIALGAPFGLEASVSFGVVSATGRGNLNLAELGDFLQTDAAINPGNSGGPLLNTSGQVIGVNTAIFSASGAYNGIGFAVPSNLARQVAEELIANGKVERGYLGVSLQAIEPGMSESLGLPPNTSGALVAHVADDSPAKAAGLKAGDVITAVNDSPIKNEYALTNSIGLMRPGTNIKLRFVRGSDQKTAEVKLGSYPRSASEGLEPADTKRPEPGPFGLQLGPLEGQVLKQFGIESKEGALVEFVKSGSPAQRAGLEHGDVILQVNGKSIKEPQDFWDHAQGKDRLLLHIERQGNYFFVSVRTSSGAG